MVSICAAPVTVLNYDLMYRQSVHPQSLHNHTASWHVSILGPPISTYSRHIVQRLATRAQVRTVHVTSVHRAVQDQARIFFQKHVKEKKPANYKSKDVAAIVAHARSLLAKGSTEKAVQAYLIQAIEQVRGGPGSISRHLVGSPFVEIFDIAHYSGTTKGTDRRNYMTDEQAKAFVAGCRELLPFPISRLGHSAELGITVPQYEFQDEKCFHLEVLQLFDGLEVKSSTKTA